MNEEKETKKGRRFWRGLAIVVGTTVVCYEIFGRKGQDVKQACNWVKDKVKKQPTTETEVDRGANNNQYQNRGDNRDRGNWNNKRNN